MFNKISGALTGLILYPLTSLIINLSFAVGITMLAALAFVFAPFFIGWLSFSKMSHLNFFEKLFKSVAISLSTVPIIVVIATIAYVSLLVLSIIDFAKYVRTGMQKGYQEGVSFVLLTDLFNNLIEFSSTLLVFFPQNKIPNLVETPPKIIFLKLSDKELEQATKLAQSKPTFVVYLEHYNDLLSRITKLNYAICLRDKSNGVSSIFPSKISLGKFTWQNKEIPALNSDIIADEVIVDMPLIKPALLVKQQKFEENNKFFWLAVPGGTHICDLDSFNQYLYSRKEQKDGFVHPLNRDKLVDSVPNPDPKSEPKEQRNYRYRIHPYKSINDVQELHDTAKYIRNELKALQLASAPATDLTNPNQATYGNLFKPQALLGNDKSIDLSLETKTNFSR